MRLRDLLQGEPPGTGREVHEPKRSGDHHDHIALARLRLLAERLPVGSERDRSLCRSPARCAAQNATARAFVLAGVGEHGAEVAPRLVEGHRRAHLATGERPPDDLLERVAVTLTEGPALGLAVVG